MVSHDKKPALMLRKHATYFARAGFATEGSPALGGGLQIHRERGAHFFDMSESPITNHYSLLTIHC